MPKHIGFLIYNEHQMLDLSGPLCAFQVAARASGDEAYRLHVLSVSGERVRSTVGLVLETEALGDVALDTLIVVGGAGSRLLGDGEISAIRGAALKTARVASVCTGAFVLAKCGLLDGRRATTHWRFAAQLQRDYPNVQVAGDLIFSKDGHVWTSAGITAGVDLALALIEEDLGPAVSRAVAQELVVYHRRPGGQSQFSAMLEMTPESDRIRLALGFARDHLTEPIPIERLAAVACLSVRQFQRAFKRETGETPAKAIERLRAEAARSRVENETEGIETIAASVGFSDPERMRRAFLRLYGAPPQAIRRSARR
ncbi:MAG: GlxA family transcriptional regulator [Capsulimonas sp.]|uniref:GlxA family transcriptional regulator n=1 Tax=Capsulimonas sp. TaxID=2494211 RepID=UPI003267BC7E